MNKRKIKKWIKNSDVISINNGYITDGYMQIKMNDIIKESFEKVYPNVNSENILIRNGNVEDIGFNLKDNIKYIKKDDDIQKVDFTNLIYIFRDKYEVLIYKKGNKKLFINRKFLDTFDLDYDGWHGVLPSDKKTKRMNGSMKIIKFDENDDIEVFILGIRIDNNSPIYKDIK